VATLADDTVRALREYLPREASTRNPVDMIASASAESFERTVRLVAADPGVDALLVLYVPPIVTRPLDVAKAIVRGAAAAKRDSEGRGESVKPVLTCFMGSHGVPEGLRSLHEGQIPSYAFPESAAIALARATRYGEWRREPEGVTPVLSGIDAPRAAATVARARARAAPGGAAWMTPAETAELLAAYGLRTADGRLARDEDAAVAAAEALGFPVVLKLVSETITHKSEVGGVALDLRDEPDVRSAFRAIRERLASRGWEDRMEGVLVQPMLREGIEAIIGMTHDASFGPLIMFGLGGVHVELLRDVAFRVHPLTDRDARSLVRSVRGHRLLDGWRGAPPGDVAALEEALLRVSQLAGDHPDIVEMDLNPLKVLPPSRGCVIVDARVAVRG
jgi:acyl-CoA synthetase (NDP forming)